MGQEDGVRVGEFCLRESTLETGACPEKPVGDRGIQALDVTVDVSEGGASVHYTLYATELPEQYGEQSASIKTTLACANLARTHGRPINRSWLEPGEYRRLGSIFTDDLSGPCEVELKYSIWDDYHLDETVLYEAVH